MKSAKERLEYIINELKINKSQFAIRLGYKSPDIVYQIIKGRLSISDSFIKRIQKSDFNINIEWLLGDLGEPFIHKLKGKYGNEYSINNTIIYPARLDFYWIKKIALSFADILFSNEREWSYQVEVKVSTIEGLEFLFTTYSFEDGIKFLNKYYSIALSVDWEVISFFDFWRVDEETRRGQNLLEINPSRKSQFRNSITKILNNIEDYNEMQPLFKRADTDFIELYKTDSRS